MYLTSGHLPYYEDSMFPPMEMASEGNVDLRARKDTREADSPI
jgi:hypothetical protein